jgi:hypothetical protein
MAVPLRTGNPEELGSNRRSNAHYPHVPQANAEIIIQAKALSFLLHGPY